LTEPVKTLFIGASQEDMTMNPLRYFRHIAISLALVLLSFAPQLRAFSLLGPYADWMAQTNGYRQSMDIGGPMNVNEEYRWNVPTITYGFDKSFIDYFGSNGVAAVESAMEIFNDLPSASSTALGDFPTDTRHVNFLAQAQGQSDLKSTVLSLVVEQLGLGQPARNVADLKAWAPELMNFPICGDGQCPNLTNFSDFVIQRNFDPQTLAPSFAVNSIAYGALISNSDSPVFHDYLEFPVDPLSSPYSAVAEAFSPWSPGLPAGTFYTGLTRDDVGGLAYLLNGTNVNWESLPRDVIFVGKHSGKNKKLRGAWRPGVEKIDFMPQPVNKRGKFKTVVFKYTATYVTNGVVNEQSVKRVVTHPDILFTMQKTNDDASPMFLRTGTEKWANNATQNGNALALGPGVIQGAVTIALDQLGAEVWSGDPYPQAMVMTRGWASFDQSTNPPVSYPLDRGQTNLMVRLNYYLASANTYTNSYDYTFNVPVSLGAPATLQITTNETDWSSLTAVTNSGSVVRWNYLGQPTHISFRVLPGRQ
jgi:hypothetical protein